MAAPLVPCLYTTIKNISGKKRAFGFLGIHGKELLPNQEHTEFGDLTSKLQGRAKTRSRVSLEKALVGFGAQPASLRIKQSVSPVLFDTVMLVPKQLTLTGGALGVADPCWGAGY